MTDFRPATAEDLQDLLRMTELAYRDGGHPDIVGDYDQGRMTALVTNLVKDEHSAVFVAEEGDRLVGMIALMLSDMIISGEYIFANELTWWVHPDHRKSGTGEKLLERAVGWAREKGAKHLWMNVPRASQSIARMCVERGFKLFESVYIRSL